MNPHYRSRVCDQERKTLFNPQIDPEARSSSAERPASRSEDGGMGQTMIIRRLAMPARRLQDRCPRETVILSRPAVSGEGPRRGDPQPEPLKLENSSPTNGRERTANLRDARLQRHATLPAFPYSEYPSETPPAGQPIRPSAEEPPSPTPLIAARSPSSRSISEASRPGAFRTSSQSGAHRCPYAHVGRSAVVHQFRKYLFRNYDAMVQGGENSHLADQNQTVDG
jgi:hypothetical protein